MNSINLPLPEKVTDRDASPVNPDKNDSDTDRTRPRGFTWWWSAARQDEPPAS